MMKYIQTMIKENKTMVSLPMMAAINIITVILSAAAVYFAGNAAQNDGISKNRASILINAKSIKDNSIIINELKHHAIILDEKTDPVQMALIKQSLQLLKEDVNSIKIDQKAFIRQQNRFYQKVSAKLGIVFN